MSNRSGFAATRRLLWLTRLIVLPFTAESGWSQVPCDQAAFTQTPTDTEVLLGSSATLFSAANGPWPIQWYENGNAIAGATNASFTTGVVTLENYTNVYTVGIVGCGTSLPAH